MTIAPVSANRTNQVQFQGAQGAHGAHRPDFAKDMQGVAKLLGVTTDELKTDLQSGKSLADLAQAKGVSRDELVSTLKQSMQANAPSDVPSDFAAHLDDIVSHIVDQKGGMQPPAHRPKADDVSGVDFGAKAAEMLNSIASALKIPPDDLVHQLQNGTNLNQIASNAGTDTSQLLDTIGRGLAVNVLA